MLLEMLLLYGGLNQTIASFRNDNGNRNRDLKKVFLDAFTLRMRKSEEIQGCSSQMAWPTANDNIWSRV